MKRILFAVLALSAMPALAYAQTAGNELDVSGFEKVAFDLAAALITALASWLIVTLRTWAATKTELANSEAAIALQARFNEAIPKVIAYAEKKADALITGGDGKVTVTNDFLAHALDYANKAWPDLFKGIDAAHLEKAIIARLPQPAPAPANG